MRQRIWQRRRFAGDGAGELAERIQTEIGELERELQRMTERDAVEKAAACVLLDRLGKNESAVLYGFYLDRLSVVSLARKLHFSEGYVRRLRKRGERALAGMPAEEIRELFPAWYLAERGDG